MVARSKADVAAREMAAAAKEPVCDDDVLESRSWTFECVRNAVYEFSGSANSKFS